MNKRAAELIASKLSTGLPHPGDPLQNRPPTLVPLPGFRTTAMPDDMAKAVNEAAVLVAEAIVNLLETEGNYELVDIATARQHKALIADAETTAITCRKCGQLLTAITGSVDAHAFKQAVSNIDEDCTTRHGAH